MTGIATFIIGKIVLLTGMLLYIRTNKLLIISSYFISLCAFYIGNYYYNRFQNDIYVVEDVPKS